MQFEKKIVKMGEASLYIPLPIELARFLEITEETVIIIQDEQGKKGPYVSAWKKTRD